MYTYFWHFERDDIFIADYDDSSFIMFFQKRKPAIFDSDVEDSAESSSDDESPPAQHADSCDALPVPDSQCVFIQNST